jgi:capsular exopolysaccharide synthesis family protein
LGITSVLAGEHSLQECLASTVIDGLTVLACGPIPPNPSELLHTTRFDRLLDQVKNEFDIAILDSPPVGVVIDAAIVGPRVDGAIVVVQAGRTSRDAVAHVLRQMRDVGSKVLGCVLNDVDLSKRSGYGGYYYYNGYYRSPEDESGGSDDGGSGAPGTSPQSSPAA